LNFVLSAINTLSPMAPPPPKKAKSTALGDLPPLGNIMDKDPLVETDGSDNDLAPNASDDDSRSHEEDEEDELEDNGDDEELTTESTPLTPPPTISKRKRGRPAGNGKKKAEAATHKGAPLST
jgi:hypothetical protein